MDDYRIEMDPSWLDLEVQVREKMKLGWIPQGGISWDANIAVYMQAMVYKKCSR